MSRRQVLTAYLGVRGWTVEDVGRVLQQHGLGEFVELFKKRNVDGESLWLLTEGMLVLWNRELSLPNIRKIGNFVEKLRNEPEKYTAALQSEYTKKPHIAEPVKPFCSSNTEFGNNPQYQNADFVDESHSKDNLQDTTNTTTRTYAKQPKDPENNFDVAEVPKPIAPAVPPLPAIPPLPAKPPVPARPPLLLPRPKVDYTTTLPVPPVPETDDLTTFISYISLVEPEEKEIAEEVESSFYETPDMDTGFVPPANRWKPKFEDWKPSQEEYSRESCSSVEYESINELLSKESIKEMFSEGYYVHPKSHNTSVKPHLDIAKLQLRELPEAPAPPLRPQGYSPNLSSRAPLPPSTYLPVPLLLSTVPLEPSTAPLPPSIPLPPSTVPLSLSTTVPPRPKESKRSELKHEEEECFDSKSERIEQVFKKVMNSPFAAACTKKEKVTASSELKLSTASSTSSLSSVTSIKANTGQATTLPDQRLPPNLRPLPPTPGTSSFRPPPTNNAASIPIRKTPNSKVGIAQYSWYHNVDRKRGEELVFNGEDGTFLVRPSTQTQNPYTLTIWFGKRVYNICVRFRADGKYALGTEKQNEQSFRSVEEMVSYYQSEQLVLYSGGERTGQTSLKSSSKKE